MGMLQQGRHQGPSQRGLPPPCAVGHGSVLTRLQLWDTESVLLLLALRTGIPGRRPGQLVTRRPKDAKGAGGGSRWVSES